MAPKLQVRPPVGVERRAQSLAGNVRAAERVRAIMQTLKALVIAILASLIGTAASCSTMVGGMHYMAEPAPVAAEA